MKNNLFVCSGGFVKMVQPCQALSHLPSLLMMCFVTVYERNELPKCIPLVAVFYKHECMSWVSKLEQTQRPAWPPPPPRCEPKRSFKQSHCSHRLKAQEDWAAADQHLGCSSARMTGIHQIMKTPCERARAHTRAFFPSCALRLQTKAERRDHTAVRPLPLCVCAPSCGPVAAVRAATVNCVVDTRAACY